MCANEIFCLFVAGSGERCTGRGACTCSGGYPLTWCSSSGVTKISIAQNISTLCKRLTTLLAVQTFSEGAGTERGVPARGCLYLLWWCPSMWCSSSGVAKMGTSQNINILSKKLTPLLVVLISSECARAREGIPVAGLLKWVLHRISMLCTKGLPRYWQCWSLQSAPEQKEVYLQCGGTPTCDVPVAGLLKWVLRRISMFCIKDLLRYWQC